MPWIEWFCKQPAHVFFCEVDYDYAADDFNLAGLSQEIEYYHYALSIILDIDDSTCRLSKLTEDQQAACDSSAQVLYGLIHARYILTNAGMSKMSEKFQEGVWGFCPNVNCGKPLLPLGLSDRPGQRTLVYCPGCNEAYVPSNPALADLDGAFFGTSFAGLFAMEHDLAVPRLFYQPRVFGFKVWSGVKDLIRAQKQLTNSQNNNNNSSNNNANNNNVGNNNNNGGNGGAQQQKQ